MKIPIINGIYSDENGDYRTSYPVNYVPVPKSTGINEGYLYPAEGINLIAYGTGPDRGGINVNGVCYRAMGSNFVRVNSDDTVDTLGFIGGIGQISLCYSFDNIGISSGGNLYYWNILASTLTQVTDPDLGVCNFVNWLDGYFVSTDGESMVVTDLANPMSVNPLKYGSSEVMPDPILSLPILRNTLYAANRYSIESFQNIGGSLFPFQRIDGAFIQRGCVGAAAICVFDDQLAFLGGGLNEPVAVWLGLNAQSKKISTREIDLRIQQHSESVLAKAIIEVRTFDSHNFLYVHLPDQTLVYDAQETAEMGISMWHVLSSASSGIGRYSAINFVFCYNKWIFGDRETNKIGTFTNKTGEHYGELVGWEFQTTIIYNDGMGAIFWEVELMCLSGNVLNGTSPQIATQYSTDQGITWSVPRFRLAGKIGEREKRLNWLQNGTMNDRRIQKFTGQSDSHLTISCLNARIEGLN